MGSRCLHSRSAETFQIAARVTPIPIAATAVLDFHVLGRDHQPPEGDLLYEKGRFSESIIRIEAPNWQRYATKLL